MNFNDHEIMKFNEIYELIIILSQIKKHHQKLEKSKNVNTIRELMHQYKMLLKTDLIMIKADKTLLNAQKTELNHQKKEKKNEISKKTLKTQSANLINMMIDDLIKKMKALTLQISTMLKVITNQIRVFLL